MKHSPSDNSQERGILVELRGAKGYVVLLLMLTFDTVYMYVYMTTLCVYLGYCGVCEHGVWWIPWQLESGHSVLLRHVCQETSNEVHDLSLLYMHVPHENV